MRKQYHILNGDALKEQFPENIKGDIIVARECLVDGNVKGSSLDALFASRAKFLSDNFGGTEHDYHEKTASEFQKILQINENSDINLWFEDDLFCQVNFWFVAHLISEFVKGCTVYLIRPPQHTPYGFGGLNEAALIEAYKGKIQIDDLDKIAGLWKSYQHGDTKQLISTANELQASFPFILRAVEAHMARIPSENDPGRPVQALIEIMKDLETEDFGAVFREFSKREAIYGFGDVQVKKLFDELKNNR
jgi:hypothetical protein